MDRREASSYNLYFIVRSLITAFIGFLTFSLVALALASLSGIQAITVSFISFAYPLLLTKMFHKRIRNVVEKLLSFLRKHERIERLVVKILE
jgi:hypothetical protein